MGCIIEFSESLIQFEFHSTGNKQRILVDMMLKYGELDINNLALTLDISVHELQEMHEGTHFLVGEKAHDLAQMFLIFFGQQFFKKFTLIRNFFD